MSKARVFWVLGCGAAVAVLSTVFHASLLKISVAVLFAAVVLRIGYGAIGGLAQPVPEPPDPGELRKVKLTYRCTLCGTEVRMTMAAAQEPEAPRHCMEDMELLTPIE
ncbi:MAG TPA: hypothetical protein DEG43_14825 [Acidimicrobiaceae bacterium]|nr:hypothetical protein [Acidimicrobiaceae bacterium]